MEKQARWSLNRSLESSRNDGGSWRFLTKVLKWRNGGEQSLPGFRIGGLAEEWCPEHLEGSKSSEKKKKSKPLFSQDTWEVGMGLQRKWRQ